MDYQNQRCEGCGLPLRAGEDIVVCPDCGTPQHRACYEKENRCVNAQRHGEAFAWQAQNEPAGEAEPMPCPVCRHKNAPDSKVCARCGQPFTAEALPAAAPQRREQSAEQLVGELFFDAPAQDMDPQLDEDGRQQVEFVLAQRMLQATPGMTEEQAQERLCGHPLRQVMTFLSSGALTYVNKFRRLEGGKAFTWNWAAFFLTPYWFFYRKLFKPGIVVMTVRICLSVVIYAPVARISELMMALSDAMRDGSLTEELYASTIEQLSVYTPVMAIAFGVLLLLAILSGLLADRLYRRHIGDTLTRLKQAESRDAFLVGFLRRSAVSPLLAVLSYMAISLIPSFIMSFIVS